MADEDRAAELEEELEQVRSELEELQVKYDAGLDEQDQKIAEMEDEFDQRAAKLAKEAKDELEEVQADCEQKVDDITAQLDRLRRAMTGDSCGWAEKKDKSGDVVYENSETGDLAYEKPEVLVFAETVRKVDGAADDKAALAKLEAKAKDADSKKREADVKYNESRAETINLRGLNKGWKESAEVVYYCLTAFDEQISSTAAKLSARADYLDEKTESVTIARRGVEGSTEKLRETQDVLEQREQELRRLNRVVDRLSSAVARAEAEAEALRESVAVQIERVAAPLRDELASAYTLLMAEKAAREQDRSHLADLWPPGWLMPSMLQKYRTLSAEERAVKRAAAEAIDAESRLKMDVRSAVAEALQWSSGYDDFGRAFYKHAVTGEQVWEPPAAMLYVPPPGRDELGNKVDGHGAEGARPKPPAMQQQKAKAEKSSETDQDVASGWEAVDDEWGQRFYRHTETGEESWERPEGAEKGSEVVSFAEELDPKTRAIHSARCVIAWLRATGTRRAIAEDEDDDHVANVEGEDIDEEAVLYDMKSVEELAKEGNDGWTYEPEEEPEDDDSSDDDSDDDDDEGDDVSDNESLEAGGSIGKPVRVKKEKKGPPTVAAMREMVYVAAVAEEELDASLRHARRKVERLSKQLIDRIHEVGKEEKEKLLPKGSNMDDEGKNAMASALAELEASMAAASATFSAGGMGLKEKEKDPEDEAREVVKTLAPVDPDTLWAEINHRRLQECAMPRGRVADHLCFELAAEAVWAGLAAQPLQEPPPVSRGSSSSSSRASEEDEEWRTRAFFARAEEAEDKRASEAPRPIAVTLRERERHRVATAAARELFEKTRTVALREADEEARDCLRAAAWETAVTANFVPFPAPEEAHGGFVVRGDALVPDGDTIRYAGSSLDTEASPFPDPRGDRLRVEAQGEKRARAMHAILDAEPVKLSEGDEEVAGRDAPPANNKTKKKPKKRVRKRAAYEAPMPKIVEAAELQAAMLTPLLEEADNLRLQLWDQHEAETERLQEVAEALRKAKTLLDDRAAGVKARQLEVSGSLRELMVPQVPPKAPQPASLDGKEVLLEMAGPDAALDLQADCALSLADAFVEDALTSIESGSQDGRVLEGPPGYHASEQQLEVLEAAVATRNAASAEREQKRFQFETKRFERQMSEFKAAEEARGAALLACRKAMQEADLEDSAVMAAKGVNGRWAAWVTHELRVCSVRADGMYTAETRACAVRAKQAVEAVRGAEALARLQDQLHYSLDERRRATNLPQGARNALERIALEHDKSAALAAVRVEVLRLREALVEEGRRRRMLYEEELVGAQAEVRRLRDLAAGSAERTASCEMVGSFFAAVRDATDYLSQVRQEEAALSSTPIYAYRSEAHAVAEASLALQEKCLEALMQGRRGGQLRERREVVEHRGLQVFQLPPHPDQWTSRAEAARHEEEVWGLRSRLEATVREVGSQVAVHVQRREDADDEMRQLRAAALAKSRVEEGAARSMREAWEHSATMLKHMLDTQRNELTAEVQRFQRALSELAREYATVKSSLSGKVEHLELRVKDLASWLAACRYDLSCETAKRLISDAERKRITFAWRRESDALRAELMSERMHSARCELWVGAMRKDVTNFTKEIWLRDRMLELQKESNNRELRALKYNAWRHATGLHLVSTDVGALFLFFAQRVANLAGSRRHYNEALRDNGAALVLAAMCRGPRQDLRRAAAQALGRMGWDGYIEQRLLGWDAKRSWALWLDHAVPLEEARLAKLNLSFTDRAPTAGDVEEVFEAPAGVSLRALIVARRQWALRNVRRKEGPNVANMRLLGAHPEVLSVLVMLTHEADLDVVRSACLALSVAAFHEHNSGSMGRLPECLDAVVRLTASEDQEVQAQAAATLANLGYGHRGNQRLIGEAQGALEKLLDLCTATDVDVIESASAALVNLVCFDKSNAASLAALGGVQILLRLLASAQTVNLLDNDQLEEIHANAAEALANVVASHDDVIASQVHHLGVAPLVLLCGSGHLQVRRHAPLVLGNICQNDAQRVAVGLRGGVEALFLVCEQRDEQTQANALWALGNLAWNPLNQDRIGRYFGALTQLCFTSPWLPVRTNATICLANALFYHDRNRARLEALPEAVQALVDLCAGPVHLAPQDGDLLRGANSDSSNASPPPLQEAALRALVSLSYTDRMSSKLGMELDVLPMLLANCQHAGERLAAQRYSLMVVLNLNALDANKRRLLACGGVEALVGCAGSEHPEVRALSAAVLQQLADLKSVDELWHAKSSFGIAGMLELIQKPSSSAMQHPVDSSTLRLAVESLAEQVWLEPHKQDELTACGGLKFLLELIGLWRSQDERVLLPALWALRNATHDHLGNQDLVGEGSGVQLLLDLCRHNSKQGQGDILESTLSALVNLCIGHERNCRRLLADGLDVLLDAAEGPSDAEEKQAPSDGSSLAWDEAMGDAERARAKARRAGAVKDVTSTNQALATSLLQIVGPYNWVTCANCSQKSSGGGTCQYCGHAVSFSSE